MFHDRGSQLITVRGFRLVLGVTLDMCHCPVMSCYVPECFTKARLELRKASTATPLLLPVFVTVKPHWELRLLSPPS